MASALGDMDSASLKITSSGEKKPINMNYFSGLSQEWVVVKFVFVLPSSWEKGKRHKQNSQESQENGGTVFRDKPVKCLFMCFLLGGFEDLLETYFFRCGCVHSN